jgi:hypothetical protein
MEPVIALCVLTVFVWAVAVVASFAGDEESEGRDANANKADHPNSGDKEDRKAA